MPREVVAGVKRYKFQALVTLDEGNELEPEARFTSAPCRMVLRGRNDETQRSRFFTALVTWDDEGPFRPGSHYRLVTLRLAGDDVAEYFAIGGHFARWQGGEVGQGIVTRRLFV
jgi:hypothetical protein